MTQTVHHDPADRGPARVTSLAPIRPASGSTERCSAGRIDASPVHCPECCTDQECRSCWPVVTLTVGVTL